MDDTIILQDNFALLFLCDEIILSNRKLFGTNIRQEGYLIGSLGAYLSFWKNGLPYSVDTNGNPLTSISKKGCRAYNFQTDCIEPASVDFPIEIIMEKFNEYRKEFKRTHNYPTLLKVVCILQNKLEKGEEPKDVFYWDIYRDKCRIAALETKLSNIQSENESLKMNLRTHEEDALRLLSSFADIIREGEEAYNRNFNICLENIENYRTALNQLRFDRMHNGIKEIMNRTQDNAYKDAVKYWQHRLRNLLAFQFHSLPEKVKALPIETINAVCDTSLKIFDPQAKRKL